MAIEVKSLGLSANIIVVGQKCEMVVKAHIIADGKDYVVEKNVTEQLATLLHISGIGKYDFVTKKQELIGITTYAKRYIKKCRK